MRPSLAVRNGEVLHPDGRLEVTDVEIAKGRITHIGSRLAGQKEIDASGSYVLPGLIDLHTHGLRGETADGNLHRLAQLHAAGGATTFCPTLGGAPDVVAEKMARLLRETDDLREVPQAVGFRLESVYLALNGAGQRTSLERIDPRVTGALLQAGGGRVRIWDISPELTGSADAIRQMSAERIVCSICHTNCTISEGRAAVEAGARLVTHMFDMFYQAEVTDPDGGVYPAGLTDYLLVEDRAVCELIADGTHVDPLLVEVAFRCKSPERVAFVTDSSRASGLAPGEHTFDDGRTLLVGGANGGVRIPDTLILAGSALSPIDGFRNAIRMFGKDLRTASQVCSTTPARLMGLNKGELASGRDADIIVLDRELSLQHVVAGGRVVYER